MLHTHTTETLGVCGESSSNDDISNLCNMQISMLIHSFESNISASVADIAAAFRASSTSMSRSLSEIAESSRHFMFYWTIVAILVSISILAHLTFLVCGIEIYFLLHDFRFTVSHRWNWTARSQSARLPANLIEFLLSYCPSRGLRTRLISSLRFLNLFVFSYLIADDCLMHVDVALLCAVSFGQGSAGRIDGLLVGLSSEQIA